MRICVGLLFLFLLSNLGEAQSGLTSINNQEPTLIFPNAGIETINGISYLIESNKESLRVSKIQDSVELLYVVSDYPTANPIHYNHGKFENRSGFIVDSIFLYEVFQFSIRKRNLLTSEIIDSYSFEWEDLRYVSHMNVVDDIIHFEKTQENDFAFYNILSGEYNTLPFQKELTFRSENNYFTSTGDLKIIKFNALEKSTTIINNASSNFVLGVDNSFNGQKGLLYSNFITTQFINADTSLVLDCDFFTPFIPEFNVIETSEFYILFYYENEKVEVKSINRSTCEENTIASYYAIHNSPRIDMYDLPSQNQNYILFSIHNTYDGPIQLNLLDLNSLTVTEIDQDIVQIVLENSFYLQEDELYFIATNFYFYTTESYLCSINLNDKSFKSKQEGFTYNAPPYRLGPFTEDSTFLLTQNDVSTQVFNFKTGSNAQFLNSTSDTYNAGLDDPRYLAIFEDKLIFEFEDSVYIADRSNNSSGSARKLIVVDEISDLAVVGNSMLGLFNSEELPYLFRYRMETGHFSTEAIDEYQRQGEESLAVSHYIFGSFTLSEKKYFDLNTLTYKHIPFDVNSYYKSGNSMLLLNNCDMGFCLTLFNEESFTNLVPTFENKPDIYSKQDGQFFLVEELNSNETKIRIVRQDGTIGDQINVFGTMVNINQMDNHEGPLSSFMLYNSATEHLEVVLHRYNDFHVFKIPYRNANIDPISWYKVGNSLILKSNDLNDPGLYVCTLGKEVRKLNFEGNQFENSDLLFAGHQQATISFLVKSPLGEIETYQYDTESELIAQHSGYSNFPTLTEHLNFGIRISPDQYLLTFKQYDNDIQLENSEFYVFNIDPPAIWLYYDFNQIQSSSDPKRFIASSTDLYFITRTHIDNSHQLFIHQRNEITSTNEEQQLSTLMPFPNPSSHFISFNHNAEKVGIYNEFGTLIRLISNYSKNQSIDILELPRGVYFLEAKIEGEIKRSKFIKI